MDGSSARRMLALAAVYLLVLVTGPSAAAVEVTQLAKSVLEPKCEGNICLGEIQCSAINGISSDLGSAVLRGRPDQLAIEKVESTTRSTVLNSSSLTKSINKDSSFNYTSSPAPEDLASTPLAPTEDAAREKRSPEADKCFLVFPKSDISSAQNASKEEGELENGGTERLVTWQVWLYGFLSVGFISLSGIFGVIFVPLMKKRIFEVVMRFLVGLGIGALSSTAIFQLIPECFQIMDSDYLSSSVVIWMTIWAFFVFESLCKIVLNQTNGQHGHSHGRRKESGAERGSRPIYKQRNDDSIEVDSFLPKSFNNGEAKAEVETKFTEAVPSLNHSKLSKENKMAFHHRSHDFLAEAPKKPGGLASISSVAWMIILGDGIHNFIDGVSIGAGFTQSPLTGLSISLAIIFEEFPHELGDFAILINSGMSVKKALAFNFASACTAFLGLILGICLEQFEINSYIFGLAGGLFLYISLSDLIPQLNLMLDEALEDESCGKKKSILILIQQNLGILTGMVLIYLITKYTDQITFSA